MILSTVIPVSATTLPQKTSHPLTMGNTLYVGGSGPNNYTKIQDAINASDNGDTVFVFDDSSPYIENIVIDKSIHLLGEEKNTTIIDGSRKGDVIYVTTDEVTINGFSMINAENSTFYIIAGININANYTTISNNIITTNSYGIVSYSNSYSGSDPWLFGNVIRNNIIHSNSVIGIWLISTKNSIVVDNIIFDNHVGIQMNDAFYNSIVGNKLTKTDYLGLSLSTSDSNEISANHITNSRYGLILMESKNNVISHNNFIDNEKRNAIFLYFIKYIGRNTWDGNYWDNSRQNIYPIFGKIALQEFIEIGIIPWFQFDWHPASGPYNIP
jgi:parallel beta-helix repeat protein